MFYRPVVGKVALVRSVRVRGFRLRALGSDGRRHQLVGNFPQTLTHVAIVNTACNLSRRGGPSEHRSRGMGDKPPGGGEIKTTRRRAAKPR